MSNTQDPNLTEAAEAIKAICRQFDIAALITLASPTGIEYVRVFDPTWSCAKLEATPEGPCISIVAKREDFPSREEQQKRISETVGIFFAFKHQAEQDQRAMQGVIDMVSQKMDIRATITQLPRTKE